MATFQNVVFILSLWLSLKHHHERDQQRGKNTFSSKQPVNFTLQCPQWQQSNKNNSTRTVRGNRINADLKHTRSDGREVIPSRRLWLYWRDWDCQHTHGVPLRQRCARNLVPFLMVVSPFKKRNTHRILRNDWLQETGTKRRTEFQWRRKHLTNNDSNVENR